MSDDIGEKGYAAQYERLAFAADNYEIFLDGDYRSFGAVIRALATGLDAEVRERDAAIASAEKAEADLTLERRMCDIHLGDLARCEVRAEKAEALLDRAVEALRQCLNFIENTESEMGETMYSGDRARTTLAAIKEAQANERA